MLSTRFLSYTPARSSQEWPWSPRARLHSLADVREPISDLAREEYASRLGTVLQMARKARRIKQVDAAAALGTSTVSFTRWEAGATGISAYDLARLVSLYELEYDAALVLDPPASKVEIKRRLEPLAQAAQRATRRGVLRPLDDDPGSAGEP